MQAYSIMAEKILYLPHNGPATIWMSKNIPFTEWHRDNFLPVKDIKR